MAESRDWFTCGGSDPVNSQRASVNRMALAGSDPVVDVVNCPREWAPMGKPDVLHAGDRVAAVSELFVAHHRRLIGLAALLVDDRGGAEEVVQEAFLTLHRQWRLLRDPTACVAYLNTCVVNGSRRRLRQRRRLAVLVPRMAAPSDVLD